MSDRESIVNELTAEVMLPRDFVSALRALERRIFRLDNVIATFKGDLKASKMEREKAIGELRSMVREAKMEARARRAGRGVKKGEGPAS